MSWITNRNPECKGKYLCTVPGGIKICDYNILWSCDGVKIDVYAWQPLPEAYRRPQIEKIEDAIATLQSKLSSLEHMLNVIPASILYQIENTLKNANIDIQTYIDISPTIHKKK